MRAWAARTGAAAWTARTPASSLAAAVQDLRPVAMVVVSHLSGGRRMAVEAIRGAQRADVASFYAGNAFGSPQSRRGVPGTYLGDHLGHAADLMAAAIALPAHSADNG